MAGVFTQIKEIYGYLVGEQRAVADFLQRCPELATQAGNQAELAELIGVEERNVLILIQSMGYLNFEQFQQELMDSLQRGEQPQREGTLTPLFGQVFGNAVQNLDRSQKMMYPKEMDRALKLMQQAHHLYLLGLRSSFTLAYYLHTRLCQVRQEVRLIHTTGLEYPEELVGITAGDVVVAFLFPHYSKNYSKSHRVGPEPWGQGDSDRGRKPRCAGGLCRCAAALLCARRGAEGVVGCTVGTGRILGRGAGRTQSGAEPALLPGGGAALDQKL